MSGLRSGTPGATRVCPHCKATVLETAAICPGCRHHLRFNADASQAAADDDYCALSVDGSISHTIATEPCEYFVVLDITDERGDKVTRQVVGVGVLQASEKRNLHLSVGMRPVRAQSAVKAQPSAATAAAPASQPAAAVARVVPQPAPVIDSRLQPRPPSKPTGPGSSGGSPPRFRNFRKP
jgi:hypothetical protein